MTLPQRSLRARIRPRALLPLLAAAGLAASGCGSAQLDGMEAQLADIQRQVLQIQKQTSSKEEVQALQADAAEQGRNLLKAQADIQLELQSLASLIEQLEGKLEDTNQRLAQLSQQIAATNQSLKSMRAAPELGGGGPGTAGPVSGSAPADPATLYQTSYNDYLRGNYDLAILGFRQYLESYSNTDLADNASYWIGESYYRQRRFQDAIREFDQVVSQYPNSDKVPSALLRKGYAYLELGEQSKGVVQLQNVIRRYPRSDEANLARQQLTTLGIDPAQPGR
jgi:tol-pal system protein YbgF